jgi:hypothetical protein
MVSAGGSASADSSDERRLSQVSHVQNLPLSFRANPESSRQVAANGNIVSGLGHLVMLLIGRDHCSSTSVSFL